MSKTIRAASCQFDVAILECERNVDKIADMTREAVARHKPDVVVFPECATSGYCLADEAEARKTSQPFDGPYTRRVQQAACEGNTAVLFGYVEEDGDNLFNASILCCPNGDVFRYRKTHMPYVGFDRFAKRGGALQAADTPLGRLGLLICYDLRFPEPLRTLSLQGANLTLHPSNLSLGSEFYYKHLSKIRTIESKVFLVHSNRIGDERGFHFFGHSHIVAPNGDILQELGEEEGIICADLDLTLAEDKNFIFKPGQQEFYIYKDRRPEFYGAIVEPLQ